MKASEFIKLIVSECNGEDPEIEFFSYEWDDDLEGLSYHEREFECIGREGDKIQVHVNR